MEVSGRGDVHVATEPPWNGPQQNDGHHGANLLVGGRHNNLQPLGFGPTELDGRHNDCSALGIVDLQNWMAVIDVQRLGNWTTEPPKSTYSWAPSERSF